MARFRMDNTEGYSQAELDALNAKFEAIMDENAGSWGADIAAGLTDDLAFKSWQDHVAEQLTAGERICTIAQKTMSGNG